MSAYIFSVQQMSAQIVEDYDSMMALIYITKLTRKEQCPIKHHIGVNVVESPTASNRLLSRKFLFFLHHLNLFSHLLLLLLSFK